MGTSRKSDCVPKVKGNDLRPRPLLPHVISCAFCSVSPKTSVLEACATTGVDCENLMLKAQALGIAVYDFAGMIPYSQSESLLDSCPYSHRI
jgi:hypothetical protein